MIIFLYGQDTYRSRQKLNEIVERYKGIHKNGLNLKYFDAKILSFQDFNDEMRQTSMFKEKKLVILIDVFSNSEFKKRFLEKGNPPTKIWWGAENIVLFYETNQISENDPLFSFLKKYSKFQEFKPLGGQRLKNWLKKEFKNLRAKIEERALEKLIDFVGNDLWRATNEIKKLASFKKNKEIKVEDIELLVRPKIETDIFKTIDAIALRNKREALELLREHLERGDSPLYLLSMINFQFRNLLIIKNFIENQKSYSTILNQSKLHPYIVKKSYWQAKKFKISELKKIYQKIFQIDLAIKTGKVNPQTGLDLLVAEI